MQATIAYYIPYKVTKKSCLYLCLISFPSLVSSDALARGMDIPKVKYVVSYELPKYVKNYVHRIGRTGRAGKKGTAVTLLLSKQVYSIISSFLITST